MKLSRYSSIKNLLLALSLSVSYMTMATETLAAEQDPYQKIEHITTQLLGIIGTHQQGYPDNETSYFNALSDLLDTTVDFKFIARSVMGPYSQKATAQQRKLFAQTFRRGLVETYGRGLINYGNQQILVVGRGPVKDGQRRLTVKQEIRGEGSVYPLQYSMARKKTGEWMVINVMINGINLGKTFRSQFAKAAQKSAGDLDTVIAQWATEAN